MTDAIEEAWLNGAIGDYLGHAEKLEQFVARLLEAAVRHAFGAAGAGPARSSG
ncbi:hypothetical protein [Micromonospora globbae]|uniref:hypothetical protein n=1 Tax=Micromonospora globbae TaxID=1894969 RepID=UPI0034121F54|nr:hypothetical protein OH732_13900 [Micromonospora globbae]